MDALCTTLCADFQSAEGASMAREALQGTLWPAGQPNGRPLRIDFITERAADLARGPPCSYAPLTGEEPLRASAARERPENTRPSSCLQRIIQ